MLRLVVPLVREHVREPVGDQDGTETEGQGRRQDEPIAPRERHGRDDADARDGHGAEQEGRQAAEDRVGDRDQGRGELGEDAHDEEEEAGRVAGFAVRAAGQGDDAVVLGEGGHGRDGAEAGDQAVEAVGEDAALDAGVEESAFDFESRHVAGGGDVADCFHHEDDVHRHEREDDGRVDAQWECLDPDERDGGRCVDARCGEVACRTGDDASDQETDDHGARLHDGTAEAFAEDDGHEDGEAETDVFGTAPWEGVGCANLRADGVGTAGWAGDAAWSSGSACPVLETALDQSNADEHDGRASDEWREDPLQYRRFGKRKADLEQ